MSSLVHWLAVFLAVSLVPPDVRASEDAQSFFRQGAELQQRGDLEAARQAYEKALKVAPQRVDVLSNLGLVYLKLGKNQQAVQHLKKALEIKPNLSAVRMFLGLAYFQEAQYLPASKELSRVVTEQPDQLQAHHLLGLCLLKLDQLPEGIAALEEALKLNPGNLAAAYTLATAYTGEGQLEKAESLLLGPLKSERGAESCLVRGSLHNARKEYRLAIDELTEAKRLNPQLSTVHSQLGHALLRLGDSDAALSAFQNELVNNRADFNANANLGWLFLRQGQYDEAAKFLQKAMALRPADTGLLYMMAQIYQAKGQYPEGVELLEKVVRNQPNYAPAHVILSRLYARLKRHDDFIREKAIIQRLAEKEQKENLSSNERYDGSVALPELP